jgi:c-di-GMP-binding flagellar brake protein YcgR
MPYLSQQAKALGERRCEQTGNPAIERRRTLRAALKWTVYIAYNGSKHPITAKTRDISSDGFYCFLSNPLTPGDRVECDIVIPTHDMFNAADVAYMRCRALVVRVEQTEDEAPFGVACRIEAYSIVHGQ